MRYRKLSPTGDFVFGGSLKDFEINTPAAVGLAVYSRLSLWLGEFFGDTSKGTPYPEGVLGKHSQAEADATLQTETLDTENVTGIRSFVSNLVNRKYSCTIDIDTIYGPTTVTLQNYVNF